VTALKMSETAFQARIIDTARAYHWLAAHYRPSINRRGRWSTAVEGDKGAPDLILAKGGRVILAELKSDNGRTTAEQRLWLAALGPHARLWRPMDWPDILAELQGGV